MADPEVSLESLFADDAAVINEVSERVLSTSNIPTLFSRFQVKPVQVTDADGTVMEPAFIDAVRTAFFDTARQWRSIDAVNRSIASNVTALQTAILTAKTEAINYTDAKFDGITSEYRGLNTDRVKEIDDLRKEVRYTDNALSTAITTATFNLNTTITENLRIVRSETDTKVSQAESRLNTTISNNYNAQSTALATVQTNISKVINDNQAAINKRVTDELASTFKTLDDQAKSNYNALSTALGTVNTNLSKQIGDNFLALDGKIDLRTKQIETVADLRNAETDLRLSMASGQGAQKGYVDGAVIERKRTTLFQIPWADPEWKEWVFGLTVSRRIDRPSAFVAFIGNLIETDRLHLRLYRRVLADLSNTDTSWPGSRTSDVLWYERDYLTAEIADAPNGVSGTPHPARFDLFGALPISPGFAWQFEITAKDRAGKAVRLTMDGGPAAGSAAVDPVWTRGFTRKADGTVFAASPMVPYALYEAVTVAEGERAVSALDRIRVSATVPRRTNTASVVNGIAVWVLTLPAISLDAGALPITTPAVQVSFYVPETKNVVAAENVLKYNEDVFLPKQWLGSVEFRRRADNFVLTEGVDYYLNRDTGSYRGLKPISNLDIVTDYVWSQSRYDLIVLNPETGALQLVNGIARDTDPNSYIPATPAGTVALMRVLVTRRFAEAIPVHEWRGMVRAGRTGPHTAWTAYCRDRLPKAMRKLLAGETWTVASFGDQNGACGPSSPYHIPGGAQRDLASYYIASRYGWETVANNVRQYDGPAGALQHVRTSLFWTMAERVNRRFNSPVAYQNWCVPETTSDDGAVKNGTVPNGRHPARLPWLMAGTWDTLFLMFGIESLKQIEFGNSYHYDNTAKIIAEAQKIGREIVVLNSPRPNEAYGDIPTDWWLRANRSIVRAARAADVAYVDFTEISGPGNEGGLGISPSLMCELDLKRGLGIYEQARYGEYLAEIFKI